MVTFAKPLADSATSTANCIAVTLTSEVFASHSCLYVGLFERAGEHFIPSRHSVAHLLTRRSSLDLDIAELSASFYST